MTHTRAIDSTRIRGADLYARALLMAGGSMAKGVRSLPLSRFVSPSLSHAFLLFRSLFTFLFLSFAFHSVSVLLFSSLPLRTSLSFPRYIVVLVFRGQYFHPSSISRSRSSRISSMSLSRARTSPLCLLSFSTFFLSLSLFSPLLSLFHSPRH